MRTEMFNTDSRKDMRVGNGIFSPPSKLSVRARGLGKYGKRWVREEVDEHLPSSQGVSGRRSGLSPICIIICYLDLRRGKVVPLV